MDDTQRAITETSNEFSAAQKDAAREAIRQWAEVARVELVETNDPEVANLLLYSGLRGCE
jgi:hypothetical protein